MEISCGHEGYQLDQWRQTCLILDFSGIGFDVGHVYLISISKPDSTVEMFTSFNGLEIHSVLNCFFHVGIVFCPDLAVTVSVMIECTTGVQTVQDQSSREKKTQNVCSIGQNRDSLLFGNSKSNSFNMYALGTRRRPEKKSAENT